MAKRPSLLVELPLLGLLALLWGSSYLFIKVSVETIAPLTLIAVRVTLASVFLLCVMRYTGAVLPRDRRSWRQLLVQSVLNSIGAWTLLAWGQQFVDSGLASVLNSTAPIFILLATWLITRHERLGWMKAVGACLGLAGVVLIVGPEVLRGLGQQVLAQLAILLGAVFYAGAAIYGKRLSHLPPVVSAAGTMLWAAFWLIPASLIVERPWQLSPSFESIAAAIVLGVFCTGVALLLYFRLLRTLGSLGVASQAYLRAGVGVALGVFVLGESISAVTGMGLLAAMLGVAAINMRSGPPKPAR